MAEQKDTPAPEKVEKSKTSGKQVVYRSLYTPKDEQTMPLEDWERLKAEKLLGNTEYIREEPVPKA